MYHISLILIGGVLGCNPSACTAAHSSPHVSPVAVALDAENHCSCQCDTEWPTFREDRAACVDTVQGELAW